jgi:hypothetical protein
VTTHIVVPVSNDTKVDGNFTQYDETLKLSWNSSGVENNYVLLHFKRLMNMYLLKNLEVSLSLKDVSNESSRLLMYFMFKVEKLIEKLIIVKFILQILH